LYAFLPIRKNLLFLKKKKQKDFALSGTRLLTSARQKEQKFFASFFQKRRIWRVLAVRPGLMSHPTGRHCLHRRNSGEGH
jgi:hypothetical protein